MQFIRHATLGLAALALSTLMGSANAGVDQSQTSQGTLISTFGQADLAQSFQQSQNNITGAGVFLFNDTRGVGAGNVTISLYDNLPTSGGTLLVSGTASNVAPGSEATVSFTQTALTPGQTYFLVFTDTNTNQGIGGATNNPYPFGEAYANTGYQANPTIDYAFQTFSGSAPVPEASTTVSFGLLLALGLGGVVIAARKRKAGSAA